MDSSENIFSFFVGALALISAMLSTISYYRTYLPGAQIKVFDELLKETKDIYDKANADGLLESEAFRDSIQNNISRYAD